MKILFSPCHYIYDEVHGGSEPSWAFNIADRICSKFPESIVVTGYKNIGSVKSYQIVELQPYKKTVDFSLRNAVIFNLKNYLATKRLSKINKFDILHHVLPFGIDITFNLFTLFNSHPPTIIGPIQSKLTFKNYDLDISDIRNFSGYKKPIKVNLSRIILNLIGFLPRFLSTITLKKASKIIVINQYTKNILLSKGIDRNKIIIIPPGVDTKLFCSSKNRNHKNRDIEVITVSYLIKRKGVDLVIKSIAEVVKEHDNVRLMIVGDGPQKNDLIGLTKKLGIEKYVIFKGFISNNKINQYYQKSDIFVCASKSEGFATVSLEALSSGLALISTKVGGFNEVIKNGKNGYLLESDDIKELSNRLSILINDNIKLKTFKRYSRALAIEKYDWESQIIPQYYKLYNRIIYA